MVKALPPSPSRVVNFALPGTRQSALTDVELRWHSGTPWPSPQNGLTAFSVSICVQGANWIVCRVPFTMCVINVILYSLN